MRKILNVRAVAMALLVAVLAAGTPLMIPHPAYAVDELLVSGILKSIDHTSKTIIMDVKSESCRGTRRFRVDNPSDMEGYQGRSLAFYINSSTCRGDKIYKVVRTKWEKKK